MKVHSSKPSPSLQAVVRRFLIVESSEARDDWHLPELGLTAAFRLSGECLLAGRRLSSRAILSGLTDHVRQHHHSHDNTMLIVHFTPLGASAITREALDALWNNNTDLGDVLGGSSQISEILERLVCAANHAQRIQILERFLTARLAAHEPDPLVQAAIDWIEHASPAARVSDLVRHIGLSQSALDRRFRRQVGAAPKRFLSLLRLNRAAQLIRSGKSLTAAAHTAGYYDQAHFNHEFSRATGVAPTDYFSREKC